MKKLVLALATASALCGCIVIHKNDGGEANLAPMIAKDIVHEKYNVDQMPVTATESLNVLFGFIKFGSTATHIADAARAHFFDTEGRVRNGAYANACDQARCDAIVGARYNVQVEDYFVFRKYTCEITGYPAKLVGVEVIENTSIPEVRK